MTSTNALGLIVERVHNRSESDLSDLSCSAICNGILWKPVACQECETHFCSMCIEKWFEKHPQQCPLRCNTFTERNCSKFIARQLAKLQITCIYRANGCQEIVPYEALEKHEQRCQYQFDKCSDCTQNILRRDLQNHQSECCSSNMRHSNQPLDNLGLSVTNDELQRLQRKQDELIQRLTRSGIIPNEDEEMMMRRISIQATSETGKLPTSRVIMNTRSASNLNDHYLCWSCKNVAWEPVSCDSCMTTFCKACSPWTGVVGKMMSFFSSNTTHGSTRCQLFQAGTLSSDFMKSISQVRFRCAYAPNGCPEELIFDDIVRHERICSYEMLPCKLCHMPLSKRNPNTGHTRRACFQHMHNKSPIQIQRQLMALFEATEEAKAENQRLQDKITTLEERLRILDNTCVKKKAEERRPEAK